MALNFPNSPTDGQLYTDTASGNRWVWDNANTVWKSTSTFTQTITVSSTQPGSPVVGQLWWSKDYGRLLVYYSDGTSSQWVDASPSDYTSALAYLNSNAAYQTANAVYGLANTALQNTSVTLAGNLTVTGNVAVKSNTFSINNVNVSPYGMMKNRIINGDFRIDQRFAGTANTSIAGSQYVVDRWRHSHGAGFVGKLRYQQNNTNGPGQTATQSATGFLNYYGANVVSSNTVNTNDYSAILQEIEGLNIADLNWGTSSASPVTLSFWVYSSIAGTHSGSILNSSSLQNRTYPFSFSISTANTWQYQTITVPGDTTGTWFSNTSSGMMVIFNLGSGSASGGTAGSWQAANYTAVTGSVNVINNANGSFYLTGVQLEKGSQATGWDWRHYTTELQLCQRYYETSGGNAFASFARGADGYAFWPFFFAVEKRANPAMTYSLSVGSYYSQTISTRGGGFGSLQSGGSASFIWGYTASAELGVTN